MNAELATRALLFTDMVNSAELRSRLGEECADKLRRVHDELIGAAVTKHGGNVLRWTGDGVKASFPASSTALSAAMAMMRSVRAYGRRSDAIAEFEIRIGLSVGEALPKMATSTGSPSSRPHDSRHSPTQARFWRPSMFRSSARDGSTLNSKTSELAY